MKFCICILAPLLMFLTSTHVFSNDFCHEITTTNTCQQDDYTALRALYLSADGDNWSGKSGWLTAAEFTANPTMPAGTDVGTWYGVTTNTDGCVTHLSLVYNRLDGSIPPEIGYLTNLIHLNLSGNSLYDDDIPSEIGNLINLTSLGLAHATFESNIPPEIGNLTELTSLALTHLSGNIPMEIGNLTNLTNLNLGFTQFEGNVPAEIGNLTQLTDVLLNGITGSIPSEFYNLAQLTNLNLQYDQFAGSISPALGNLTALTQLTLSGVTGNIPSELGNLSNLEQLNLSDNQLSGTIPSELGSLVLLKSLSLSNNQLTGNIPPEFGNLSNLEGLGLSRNQFTGSIPPELGNLIQLGYLSLHHNQLTGNIPPELGNLIQLEQLFLSHNQLTGNIPSELGNLTDIKKLSLSDNQLTGRIPAQFGNLERLWDLHLNHNQLSTCYPDNLSNLCGQLGIGDDWPNYPNEYISDGNDFNATWQDFCGNNAGVCPASACTSRAVDTHLAAVSGEFGQFANDRFIKNFLTAESGYIKHRAEIHRILESEDTRYTKVHEDFDNIKDIALTMLFKSFVSKDPVHITDEHIKAMDDFLASLSQATTKSRIKDEVTRVRHLLHVMNDKEVKDALIAFDRADAATTPFDSSSEFEVQLLNTNEQTSYISYHLSNQANVSIRLYSANGQQISHIQSNNSEGYHQIPIDKSTLPAGIHFIHIEYLSGNGVPVKKVFKLPVLH